MHPLRNGGSSLKGDAMNRIKLGLVMALVALAAFASFAATDGLGNVTSGGYACVATDGSVNGNDEAARSWNDNAIVDGLVCLANGQWMDPDPVTAVCAGLSGNEVTATRGEENQVYAISGTACDLLTINGGASIDNGARANQ